MVSHVRSSDVRSRWASEQLCFKDAVIWLRTGFTLSWKTAVQSRWKKISKELKWFNWNKIYFPLQTYSSGGSKNLYFECVTDWRVPVAWSEVDSNRGSDGAVLGARWEEIQCREEDVWVPSCDGGQEGSVSRRYHTSARYHHLFLRWTWRT